MRALAAAPIAALLAVPWLATVPAAVAAGRAGGVAPATAACTQLRVERLLPEAPSTLLRVVLPAGAASPVAELGYRINAIGLAGGVVYGVALGDGDGPFPDGGHLVAVGDTGQVADLGPFGARPGVPLPLGGLAGALAGAGAGDRLFLRDGTGLYAIDVDPASPSYRQAVAAVPLTPALPALAVDDFDLNPADGLLYGVSQGGAVTSIDPVTGEVHAVPGPGLLPAGTSYGATTFGPDGALYAAANDLGGRSRLFRVPLDGSGPATEVATRPAVASADAAGCRPIPEPPTTPPTVTTPPGPPLPTAAPPPPRTLPRPPASPTPPPSSSPATLAPVPPPGPSAPRPSPPPTPIPAGAASLEPPDLAEPLSSRAAGPEQTEAKRRWALTVLLLVLGAGAAARMTARRRRG